MVNIKSKDGVIFLF